MKIGYYFGEGLANNAKCLSFDECFFIYMAKAWRLVAKGNIFRGYSPCIRRNVQPLTFAMHSQTIRNAFVKITFGL